MCMLAYRNLAFHHFLKIFKKIIYLELILVEEAQLHVFRNSKE